MKKRTKRPYPVISFEGVTIRHPAGVKVLVPLRDFAEFASSLCNLRRFRWKAKKTAEALEEVNRLSMEAMLAWANVTSPYVRLGIVDQEDSRQAPPSGDPRPSEGASDSTGK